MKGAAFGVSFDATERITDKIFKLFFQRRFCTCYAGILSKKKPNTAVRFLVWGLLTIIYYCYCLFVDVCVGVAIESGEIAVPGDLNLSPKFQRRLSISV